MRLCKYTLTLCLSLVVSYMLLPANFSYAETSEEGTKTETSSPKNNLSGNPFDDKSFVPKEADNAALLKQIDEAKTTLKNAEKEAEAQERIAKELGVDSGVLREARSSAKDGKSFDVDYSNYSKEQKDAIFNYLTSYNKYLSAESSLENLKSTSGKGGELFYIDTPDGNNIVYFKKDDKGNFVSVGGTSDGCTPLPIKLAESRRCLFCPLFAVLYDTANSMSTKSFSGLAGPITSALIIGFGIYIAFKVMFLVSGFTKQDGPKFISELLTQTFKVFVAILLLVNSDHIYGYVITPLLETGLEFGSAFLFSAGKELFLLCQDTINIADLKVSDGVLSQKLYLKLHCFVLSVQVEIAFSQAIGSSLMCISTNAAAGNFIVKNILPDLSMLIQGLVIWGFSLLVSLAFAFYLIDATVRIGIIGALLPFLIATWPFKITAKYSSTGFTMLMNTFFIYTFVGIVISVNIQLMGSALGGPGGFDEIQALINGDNVQELKQKLDTGMAGFLILVGCCLFGFKLTSESSQLANSFAGGGGEDIGNKIGGLAASAVKGGVKAAGSAATGGAKALGAATGATAKIQGARDNAARSIGQRIGMGRYSGAAGKAGKGVENAGKGVEAAGKGMEAAGKGADAAGKGISGAGKALSSTGVGAIVGAPMIAVGAATQATGKATVAAGKATKAAGKGMKGVGKGVQAADQTVQAAKNNRKDEKNEK